MRLLTTSTWKILHWRNTHFERTIQVTPSNQMTPLCYRQYQIITQDYTLLSWRSKQLQEKYMETYELIEFGIPLLDWHITRNRCLLTVKQCSTNESAAVARIRVHRPPKNIFGFQIVEYNIDIVCIIETFLSPAKKIFVSGFVTYHHDRTNGREGGTAILVEAAIKHVQSPSPSPTLSALTTNAPKAVLGWLQVKIAPILSFLEKHQNFGRPKTWTPRFSASGRNLVLRWEVVSPRKKRQFRTVFSSNQRRIQFGIASVAPAIQLLRTGSVASNTASMNFRE